MKRYEQSLIENDNQKTNDVAYNQEILTTISTFF